MNRKGLEEKREDLKNQMASLLDNAKKEERALSTEEAEKFDGLEKEIKEIDATIEREDKLSNMEEKTVKVDETKELTAEEKRYYNSIEERDDYNAFADYIRAQVSGMSTRAETQLTKGDNGAVIPKTIVNKIIMQLKDICPVYAMATHYVIGGTINVPVDNEATDTITVAYATEFTDLTSHSSKLTSIELTGYLYGALTKISRSLLRNTNFNLTEFVINKMVYKIAQFIEKELLYGTTNKVSGIVGSYDSTNMKVTLANKSAITGDELITIQELVPDAYQGNAIWVMNRATRSAIRKLKNTQGDYLLNRDMNARWGYTLLGKDVYCSDNVDKLGTASKNVLFYGDMSGLAVKESETTEVQILDQAFATQHAIGVVAWGEIDAKVEDVQKIAVAVAPAS